MRMGVLAFPCDSSMLMRFSRTDEVLPCSRCSPALMKFGARSCSSACASVVRHAPIRFRYLDLDSVPGSQMRTAKSRAPDDHERQPKNEFWTNFKKNLTGRKVLVSSMSDDFFSVVGACLEVLEGCQG